MNRSPIIPDGVGCGGVCPSVVPRLSNTSRLASSDRAGPTRGSHRRGGGGMEWSLGANDDSVAWVLDEEDALL